MKGNKKLVLVLNSLLAEELSAINQYILHSEMCENWGYRDLYKALYKLFTDELHHAELIIERIVYYEGLPMLSKVNSIKIGRSVLEMINNDYVKELDGLRDYNEAIKLCREMDELGTVGILTKIIRIEEQHIEWTETQLLQIEQVGIENYLVSQTNAPVI